jgi:hypothetical protein
MDSRLVEPLNLESVVIIEWFYLKMVINVGLGEHIFRCAVLGY